MKKRWICLVCLVAVSLAGTLSSTEVSAQIKAALTRAMDGPIRGVRQIEEINTSFGASDFSVSQVITPTIPAGKKLFLQSITMHTVLTDNQAMMEARFTLNPSGIFLAWVPQMFQAASTATPSQRHYVGNQEVNVLLDPGESISVFLFRNDNLGSSSFNFTRGSIIGYLVDANP